MLRSVTAIFQEQSKHSMSFMRFMKNFGCSIRLANAIRRIGTFGLYIDIVQKSVALITPNRGQSQIWSKHEILTLVNNKQANGNRNISGTRDVEFMIFKHHR